MTMLVIGLVLFFVVHLVPSLPKLRAGLMETLGPGVYRIAFTLVSAVGLVLIVLGYGAARGAGAANPQLWVPPIWIRHFVFLLMIPAMVLLVAAFVPSRIRTAVRHPLLTAVIIWAFGHLLANGDLASLLLFGVFLAWAVYDWASAMRRNALGPLGAAKGGMAQDAGVIAAGLGLYALMLFWGHAKLIGVPLLP